MELTNACSKRTKTVAEGSEERGCRKNRTPQASRALSQPPDSESANKPRAGLNSSRPRRSAVKVCGAITGRWCAVALLNREDTKALRCERRKKSFYRGSAEGRKRGKRTRFEFFALNFAASRLGDSDFFRRRCRWLWCRRSILRGRVRRRGRPSRKGRGRLPWHCWRRRPGCGWPCGGPSSGRGSHRT